MSSVLRSITWQDIAGLAILAGSVLVIVRTFTRKR